MGTLNIRLMRLIDLYAGGTICLFLHIYEKIKRPIRSKLNHPNYPTDFKKILVTKYLGMGSIMLATPMLRALRVKYPQSNIVLLTFDKNAELAGVLDMINEVAAIRTSSFSKFAIDTFRILCRLHHEKFDVVFDLEFFARFSRMVSYFSGAKVRVGYYLPELWKGDLLTHKIYFNPHKHVSEVFAAQIKPFVGEISDFTLTLPRLDEEASQRIKSLLEEKNVNQEKLIVTVNVNSSELCLERRWPKQNFIDLISYISDSLNQNAKVILVGSRDDVEYLKIIYDAFTKRVRDNVLNFAGLLNMKEFIALIKLSRIFISNDSGPLHIASALGIRTISFFGPESPDRYGPLGKNNTVFYANIYCSPCLNVFNAKTAMCNGSNICMQNISPAEVIEVLKKDPIWNYAKEKNQ